VENGATLTIAPGSNINFTQNKCLRIYGTLNANGTSTNRITFDRSETSGTWGGICFSGSADGQFEYCNIKNAETGIELDNCSLNVEYTNFRDCPIAIDLEGLSYTSLYGCELTGSEVFASYVDVGSNTDAKYSLFSNDPFNEYSYGIFNLGDITALYCQISDAGTGLFIDEDAWADLGDAETEETGFNNILNNTDYDIETYEDILAQNNYWGGEEPENFGGSGSVDYEPWLDEPDGDNPWDGGGNNFSKSSLAKTSVNSCGVANDYKSEAFKLFSLGRSQIRKSNYNKACKTFEELLASYPESRFAPFALQRWILCKFRLDEKENILSYLETLKSSKSQRLLDYIDKMEVLVQRKFGNTQTALSLISTSKNASKPDGYNSFFKYQKGLIYQYDLNDPEQAEKIFKEYMTEYPDNNRIPLVQRHLNLLLVANQSRVKKLSPDEKNTYEKNFSKEFVLYPAYPNPFNPSTIIRYALPKEGEVTVAVYDLRGRKVKTLFGGFQSAGYHTVQWDGTNEQGQAVTSGVYLYRIQTAGKTQSRKMLLLK